MKILLVLILLATEVLAACNKRTVRREIRDLSAKEVKDFVLAVRALHQKSSINNISKYDAIVNIHLANAMTAHGVPAFFPWHRKYLLEFEKALQQINPSVTVPYWDWTLDSQAPEKSIIFSNEYFGGNGSGLDFCVKTGPFSDWNMFYPFKKCLSRNFDGGDVMGSLVAPEILKMMISQGNVYDSFRQTIEGTPHGLVHINIGGDMGTMHSPNDPIFWLHHAFVDKIWYEYQNKGIQFLNRYDSIDNPKLSVEDIMAPWNVSVKSVMNINDLCYSYANPQFVIPNGQTTTSTLIEPTATIQTLATSTTSEPATTSTSSTMTSSHEVNTATSTTAIGNTSKPITKTNTETSNSTAATTSKTTVTTSAIETTTSSSHTTKTKATSVSSSSTSSIVTHDHTLTGTTIVPTQHSSTANKETATITKTVPSKETEFPKKPCSGYGREELAEAAIRRVLSLPVSAIEECQAIKKYFGIDKKQIEEDARKFNIPTHDRKDKLKLRLPPPLNEHWIVHHNLKMDAIRNTEAIIEHAYGILNSEPDFISSAAPSKIEKEFSKFYSSKIQQLRLYVQDSVHYAIPLISDK